MFYRVVEEGLSVGGPTLRYMDVRFGMNHHSLKQERVMFFGAVKGGLFVCNSWFGIWDYRFGIKQHRKVTNLMFHARVIER